MKHVPLIFVFALSLIAPTLAADQQTPAHDAAQRSSVGTATIAGTILTDEPNSRPLRRVTVMLNTSATGPSVPRVTTSDDQGRFAFTRLPAGNYSALRATKAGYVAMAYGQKRVGGPGVPITLTEGQRMTIAMKMLRGGVITGAITDDAGQPVAQVQVQANQIRVVNGERQPAAMSFNGATTDDRGVYRIYGLTPGDYLVVVIPRLGGTSDIRPVTADEVQWAQQQLQQTAGGTGAPTSPAPKPAQAVAYSPIYYPGSTDAGGASPITVTAGQEVSSINFRVQFVPTARIEGMVLDPEGQPAQNVQLNVIPKLDAWAANLSAIVMLETMIGTRPQVIGGKFTIQALKPGEYTISARAAPRGAIPAGGAGGAGAGGGRGAPMPSAPMSLWALAEISVAGVDQSGIVLRLEPGMTLAGRLAFEGDVLQPPTDFSRVNLRLTSAPNPTGVTVSVNPATAQIDPDGSFTFSGVTPGKYLLSANAPAAAPVAGVSWQLKSLMAGRTDHADTPIEVKPGQDLGNMMLTFTDKAAEVSGTLSDAAGKPTSEFSVILFSTDKALWSTRSRRFRTPVRAGMDGKFKFTGLPPGEYYLAALTDFEPSDVTNPLFLEQVVPSAMKIVLTEGEKKTQDLKLAGGV